MKIEFIPAAGKPRDLELQPGDKIAFRSTAGLADHAGLVEITKVQPDTLTVRYPNGQMGALVGAETIYAMYELVDFAPGTEQHRAAAADHSADQPTPSAQIGDVVVLFRQADDDDLDGASPLLLQHAVLGALRQAGLLPAEDPARDARSIAEFKDRARLARPQVRRRGRTGWNL